MLTLASPAVKAALASAMQEGSSKSIEVSDCPVAAVKFLMELVYTGGFAEDISIGCLWLSRPEELKTYHAPWKTTPAKCCLTCVARRAECTAVLIEEDLYPPVFQRLWRQIMAMSHEQRRRRGKAPVDGVASPLEPERRCGCRLRTTSPGLGLPQALV